MTFDVLLPLLFCRPHRYRYWCSFRKPRLFPGLHGNGSKLEIFRTLRKLCRLRRSFPVQDDSQIKMIVFFWATYDVWARLSLSVDTSKRQGYQSLYIKALSVGAGEFILSTNRKVRISKLIQRGNSDDRRLCFIGKSFRWLKKMIWYVRGRWGGGGWGRWVGYNVPLMLLTIFKSWKRSSLSIGINFTVVVIRVQRYFVLFFLEVVRQD